MKFYTYIWLDEDRIPYYVGKGTRGRAFTNRDHCVDRPPKDRIIIIPRRDEESAYAEEIRLISLFGRIGQGTGSLFNRTNGGERPPRQTGHIPTPKQLAASSKQGKKNAASGLLKRIGRENCVQGGKTVTPKKLEHLRRVADKLRGVPRPEEVKRKLLEGLKTAHAKYPGKAWRRYAISK